MIIEKPKIKISYQVVKNEVFETDGVVEDSKNEFEKEKSYRAKAKDFSQQKVKNPLNRLQKYNLKIKVWILLKQKRLRSVKINWSQ